MHGTYKPAAVRAKREGTQVANNIKTEVQESGMVEQVQKVELADLAAAFDLPATRLQRELSLLGWGMIVNEAIRLAHADDSDRNVGQRRILKSLKDLDGVGRPRSGRRLPHDRTQYGAGF